MNKSDKAFWRIIGTVTISILLVALVFGAQRALGGNYLSHASFITIAIIIIGIVIGVYLAIKALRYIWIPFILIALIAQSCQYAKSNQQVVISTDCGMTWEEVKAGESVPTGTGNRCFMKVVMPNFPMQGDSRFIANLKDKVRATTHIDYDYSIIQPLAFIKQAKYLGSANTDADSDAAMNNKVFEGAENTVIDKRIRDVAKRLFVTEDIVELDQSDLEQNLLDECNKILEPLGIRLNFITLTFDLDDQTRQAIDVSTAMKIYASKGIAEVGKEVMVMRAGATKITVENKSNVDQPE